MLTAPDILSFGSPQPTISLMNHQPIGACASMHAACMQAVSIEESEAINKPPANCWQQYKNHTSPLSYALSCQSVIARIKGIEDTDSSERF